MTYTDSSLKNNNSLKIPISLFCRYLLHPTGRQFSKYNHIRNGKRQAFIFNLYYFLLQFLAPKVFKEFFKLRFTEVAVGLHARAVGTKFRELTYEFRELQKSSSIENPNLDELISYATNS